MRLGQKISQKGAKEDAEAQPASRALRAIVPLRETDARPAAVAVRVRGLVKRYADGTEANRGIDLDVRTGEVLAVLGPNGAGKTTFLRQLTTELLPSSGTIEVFGEDAVATPQSVKRRMGVTPQEAGVFETLTVWEHLALFGRLKGLSHADARRETAVLLDELDLADLSAKRVGRLSGGQRRRVLIGLALLGRPPLLVLDEPTTGLDPSSRRAVWAVIRRAVARGATVILSTHHMEEAERLSDRVAIVAAGRLIALGTVAELLEGVDQRFRLSYSAPEGEEVVEYFDTLEEAERCAAALELSAFSVARASLEDVYFRLTGEPFDPPGEDR